MSFSSKNATKNLDREDADIRTAMKNGSAGHYPEPNMTHYTFTQENDMGGIVTNIPHPEPNLSTNL